MTSCLRARYIGHRVLPSEVTIPASIPAFAKVACTDCATSGNGDAFSVSSRIPNPSGYPASASSALAASTSSE